MKKIVLLLLSTLYLFSCGSLFEGVADSKSCTPEGVWYYFDFGNQGPYHININGKSGKYDKVGLGSNADQAIKAGIISTTDFAIRNIEKIGTNNDNPQYSAEFRTYQTNQNGKVVSSFFDPCTIEVQTLNTSLNPCNMLMITDPSGYIVFAEKIE